jgi:hypothetical protein
MIRSVAFLIALTLSVTCTDVDQSGRTLATQNDFKRDNCQTLLEVIIKNQIDRFLTADRIDYVARLSIDDLRAFSPGLAVQDLRNLQTELRILKMQNGAAGFTDQVKEYLRREIEIDEEMLYLMQKKLTSWRNDVASEIQLRSQNELLGLSEEKPLTQQNFRRIVAEKISQVNLKDAFLRSIPSKETRHYFFTHGVASRPFREIFTKTSQSNDETIKKLSQLAGLTNKNVSTLRNQVSSYFIREGIDNQTDELVVKLFSTYLSEKLVAVNPDNIVKYVTSNLDTMKGSWANGPFRTTSLAEGFRSGLIPNGLFLHQTSISAPFLGVRTTPLSYLKNLIVLDLYLKPTEIFSSYLANVEGTRALFELLVKPAEFWESGLITTRPQITRVLTEPTLSIAEQVGTAEIDRVASKITLFRKIAALSAISGGAVGGLAYLMVTITDR